MFCQLPSSEEQRHNAASFCNEFVENNYKNWQAFFGSIVDPANSEIVRFFFLQALTDIVKDKFEKRYERPQCRAFNQSVVDLIKAHLVNEGINESSHRKFLELQLLQKKREIAQIEEQLANMRLMDDMSRDKSRPNSIMRGRPNS